MLVASNVLVVRWDWQKPLSWLLGAVCSFGTVGYLTLPEAHAFKCPNLEWWNGGSVVLCVTTIWNDEKSIDLRLKWELKRWKVSLTFMSRGWQNVSSRENFSQSEANVWNASAIWLILPVVICLSQRLSHAGLSPCRFKVRPRMAHYISYGSLDLRLHLDNPGNSRANTCIPTPTF